MIELKRAANWRLPRAAIVLGTTLTKRLFAHVPIPIINFHKKNATKTAVIIHNTTIINKIFTSSNESEPYATVPK